MKKFFVLLMFFCVSGFIFGNDTLFYVSGGNLVPAEEKDTSIEMKYEVITIVLEPEYYEVTVDFSFYNYGDTVNLLVGFPIFEVGAGGHGKIYDFKCWTNGELKDYSDVPLVRSFSNINYDEPELENAYTRTITFPGNAMTNTRVQYKSEYGRNVGGKIVKYLYGTGSSWQGDIGEITLILENNLPYDYPASFILPDGKRTEFKRVKDNRWEVRFYNVEPEYTECITIYATDILHDTGPKAFPLYGYRFCDKKATTESLFWYTKPQLRILRNTIYALHGYDFKSEDLKELFISWGKYWSPSYKVNPNFSEEELSEIEKYNIQLIYAEENRR